MMTQKENMFCVLEICNMKQLMTVVFAVLFSVVNAHSDDKITTAQYIEMYAPIAQREMEAYKIPASIKLAQGILESSSGNSPLAKEAKNHVRKTGRVQPTFRMTMKKMNVFANTNLF